MDGDSRLKGRGQPSPHGPGTEPVPQDRSPGPEEGQGETLNCLRLFHTPTGINLRSREEKNGAGYVQLGGWGDTLTHLRASQVRRAD